jgi:AcrR family transcriptional regulator
MATLQPLPDPHGGFGERARTLLRDIALQATVDIVRTRGWARTRMADIAALAGISKPTLYKYFGSKEQLAREYVDREVDSILSVSRAKLEAYPGDPERALKEGLHDILDDLSRNPLIRAIFTDDAAAASLLPLVTTHGQRLLNRAVAEFAEIVDAAVPGFDPADLRAYSDTMVRGLISHAILPSSSVDDSVDTMLRVALPVLRKRASGSDQTVDGCAQTLNDERKSE